MSSASSNSPNSSPLSFSSDEGSVQSWWDVNDQDRLTEILVKIREQRYDELAETVSDEELIKEFRQPILLTLMTSNAHETKAGIALFQTFALKARILPMDLFQFKELSKSKAIIKDITEFNEELPSKPLGIRLAAVP